MGGLDTYRLDTELRTGWCEGGGRRLTRCRSSEQGEEDEVPSCAPWEVTRPGGAHTGTQATPLHTDQHSHRCTHSPIRVRAACTHKPTHTGLHDTTYSCRYTHTSSLTETQMCEKTLHKLYHALPGQSTRASALHLFTPFTTNPCRGRSLITPISRKSKLSLAVRLPPAAPGAGA